jgi:hypothetical protein
MSVVHSTLACVSSSPLGPGPAFARTSGRRSDTDSRYPLNLRRSDNPGSQWDLTHQEGGRKADGHRDDRHQGELEQVFKLKVAQRDGEKGDERSMGDEDGVGVPRQERTQPARAV